MISTPRRLAAIASAAGALVVGLPVAGAYAAGSPSSTPVPTFNLPTFNVPQTAPATPLPSLPSGSGTAMTFVPPKVGPIAVNIGEVMIDGKVISPALHVATPGVTLPPISSAHP
ncbi:MAG TPA: hypothetical protein VH210_13740 [Gaiellaceae bacterium]|nr:hypothetical protein [Gaiellaceae bacterium]